MCGQSGVVGLEFRTMPRENLVTLAAMRVARIPFALSNNKTFKIPKKALILQTCCLSQVMLATPLLAALQDSFPDAQFDWAVSDWARPAIAGNPRLTELVSTGAGNLPRKSWREIGSLVKRLRRERYDTCFIPSRSGLLSYIAWRAEIPQRIGLNFRGRGFAHTMAVTVRPEVKHAAALYLSLGEAVGIDEEIIRSAGSEFYPPDRDRLAMTQHLVEEMDWLGDKPLVIVHPGGGENPATSEPLKRWPVERFALLGNHLARKYEARIVLVGASTELDLAKAISGLLAAKPTNLCGQLSLGEIGALCEVADLYIGNDTGPSHIAAAVGCSTLVIYGPTDPAYSKPYSSKAEVVALRHDASRIEKERPFTWDIGVTVRQAIEAVEELMDKATDRSDALAQLTGREK